MQYVRAVPECSFGSWNRYLRLLTRKKCSAIENSCSEAFQRGDDFLHSGVMHRTIPHFRDTDEWLENEMEIHRLRWEIARERAEEIVREMGIRDDDDDFAFMVHDEAKRQWDEEYERELYKRGYDDLLHSE